MLHGPLAAHGYDWWWHSFTGTDIATGEETPFFVEYFIVNPALAEDEPVLGQLPENKEAGKRPSYLMVKAGAWGKQPVQLHRFFSLRKVDISERVPYMVTAEDCLATEDRICGSVSVSEEAASAHPEWMSDSGEMTWDLAIRKEIPFNVGYGASKPLRDMEAFQMYWHAEGMKSSYEGTVCLNGREYRVSWEGSYGYADKNWGRDFTSPWVWLSSNCLKSRLSGKMLQNSAFDIGGGRPKIYFVPLDRRLLGAMVYEGKAYDFNFSKLHLHVHMDFAFSEEDPEYVTWHVRQETIHAVMETEIRCRKREMLFVRYEAPDGSMRHQRLWNGGGGFGTIRLWEKKDGQLVLVDEMETTHVGCEYGEYQEEDIG